MIPTIIGTEEYLKKELSDESAVLANQVFEQCAKYAKDNAYIDSAAKKFHGGLSNRKVKLWYDSFMEAYNHVLSEVSYLPEVRLGIEARLGGRIKSIMVPGEYERLVMSKRKPAAVSWKAVTSVLMASGGAVTRIFKGIGRFVCMAIGVSVPEILLSPDDTLLKGIHTTEEYLKGKLGGEDPVIVKAFEVFEECAKFADQRLEIDSIKSKFQGKITNEQVRTWYDAFKQAYESEGIKGDIRSSGLNTDDIHSRIMGRIAERISGLMKPGEYQRLMLQQTDFMKKTWPNVLGVLSTVGKATISAFQAIGQYTCLALGMTVAAPFLATDKVFGSDLVTSDIKKAFRR